MKYLILISVVIASVVANAQQRVDTEEDYLRKGRKYQRTAWILVGSGATMITAGTILALNTEWGDLDYDDAYHGRQETMRATAAVVLIGGGVIASVGSIPFFVMAAKNKTRAASFSLSSQRYHYPAGGKMLTSSLPAFTLRFRL